MKRALIAVGVSSIVFAGVFGLAASLSISSGGLGAGSSVVAACQAGTINVTYDGGYSAAAPAGYRATTVTLNNLDTSAGACGSKSVKVTLTGPSGSAASLGEQTGTTPASGTTMPLTFTGVNASDVTGIHVTISG